MMCSICGDKIQQGGWFYYNGIDPDGTVCDRQHLTHLPKGWRMVPIMEHIYSSPRSAEIPAPVTLGKVGKE